MHRLRELREQQGMTQAELALAAGVSRQLVGAAESGKHLPTVDAALRLAESLGVAVEDVFGRRPRTTDPVRLAGTAAAGTPLRVARVGEARVAVPLGDLGGRGFFAVADGVVSEDGVRVLPGAEVDGLVVAGCDPALGIAESLLAHRRRNRTIALYQSTGSAIELLTQGLVHGVLVHGPEGALPTPPLPVRRWRVGAWQVGIAFAPELGRPSVERLVGGDVELAQREETAASQEALRRALAALGAPSPVGPIVEGHLDGARRTAITRGAAVSMEPAANVFGLGFSPLETHVVDLWIDARWEGHPGVGHLVELLGSEQFGSRVALVGSYDLSAAGVELENV